MMDPFGESIGATRSFTAPTTKVAVGYMLAVVYLRFLPAMELFAVSTLVTPFTAPHTMALQFPGFKFPAA